MINQHSIRSRILGDWNLWGCPPALQLMPRAHSDIILLVCQFGLRGRCRCVCRCVCLTRSSVCLTLSVSSLWRLLHAADRPLLFLLLSGEAVEDLLQRRLRYCVPVPANQWYQIVSQRISTLYQMTEESLFRMTE